MASSITVTFEFEIGELVFVKGAQHIAGYRPKRFCIAERMVREYSGGIREFYKLTLTDCDWVPGIVLTRDEPKYRPMSPAEVADHRSTQREIYWRGLRADSEKPATEGSE